MKPTFNLLLSFISVQIIFLTAVQLCIAQTTIRGQVSKLDAEQGAPFVDVYLDRTSVGTSTDENGVFELQTELKGTYKLLASSVGYYSNITDIKLGSDSVHIINLKLEEDLSTQSIRAKVKQNKKWRKGLDKFKHYLLGESVIAMQCEILNPEVLEFESDEHFFKAKASSPLIINNPQLGYKIHYNLNSLTYVKKDNIVRYSGQARYEDIINPYTKAGKEVQKRRQQIYKESAMRMLIPSADEQNQNEDFATSYLGETLPLDYQPIVELEYESNFEKDFADRLSQSLKYYNEQFPVERAYLDFDNCKVEPGDTIRFRAELRLGSDGVMSELSKTLYVELIDSDLRLVKHIRVRLDNGTGYGEIVIPRHIKRTYTFVRAYTSWMKNFNEDYYFIKRINWLNPSQDADVQHATFHPESGVILNNVKTSLAIHAVDENGLGIASSGQIYDEAGKLVSKFETSTLGWALVNNLKLESEKDYYALFEISNRRFFLPKAQTSGVAMSVQENETDFLVDLKTANLKEEQEMGYLLVQNKGVISYLTPVELTDDRKRVSIPKTLFGQGVSVISYGYEGFKKEIHRAVFNQWGKETLESDQKGSCNLADEKSYYFLRSETLNTLIDNSDLLIQEGRGNTLLKPFLLSHYWRTLPIRKLYNGEYPELKFDPEQGISFSGKVLPKEYKAPFRNKVLDLMVKTDNPAFYSANVDRDGSFKFENVDFTDTTDLVFNIADIRQRFDVNIDSIKYTYDPPTFNFIQPEVGLSIKPTEYIYPGDTDYSDALILDEIEITGKKETIDPLSTSPTLHGEADHVIDFGDDNYELQTAAMQGGLLNYLSGRVPGVHAIYGPYGVSNLMIRGSVGPLYIFNTIPVDVNFVRNMDWQQVQRVEILKGPTTAIYGSRGAAGVVVIISKNRMSTPAYVKNVVSRNLRGYSVNP